MESYYGGVFFVHVGNAKWELKEKGIANAASMERYSWHCKHGLGDCCTVADTVKAGYPCAGWVVWVSAITIGAPEGSRRHRFEEHLSPYIWIYWWTRYDHRLFMFLIFTCIVHKHDINFHMSIFSTRLQSEALGTLCTFIFIISWCDLLSSIN